MKTIITLVLLLGGASIWAITFLNINLVKKESLNKKEVIQDSLDQNSILLVSFNGKDQGNFKIKLQSKVNNAIFDFKKDICIVNGKSHAVSSENKQKLKELLKDEQVTSKKLLNFPVKIFTINNEIEFVDINNSKDDQTLKNLKKEIFDLADLGKSEKLFDKIKQFEDLLQIKFPQYNLKEFKEINAKSQKFQTDALALLPIEFQQVIGDKFGFIGDLPTPPPPPPVPTAKDFPIPPSPPVPPTPKRKK